MNLRDHPNQRVRDKAQMLGVMAHEALPLVVGSLGQVDTKAQVWMSKLANEIERETGGMDIHQSILAKAVLPNMIRLAKVTDMLGVIQQPKFLKRSFRQVSQQGMMHRKLARLVS
jgi:adenine deaminase